MSAERLANHWRERPHEDPLYRALLPAMADDLEADGPVAAVLDGRREAPRSEAVHLRLLGGLFRVVLRGDAPELVRFYPVLADRHGVAAADPEEAWSVVRPVLAAHVEELRAALDLAPQTNEVGRTACLAVGLFEAVRRHGLSRVRVLEPGASAGLGLLADRIRFTGPDWTWGPADSPLVLDTGAGARGVRPEPLEIVERRGCDLSPVDATTPEGAAYLTSFVWPFDLERHRRLAAALAIVREHPVTVDRAPAAAWLADQLAEDADDGVLTVVWHSITAQYWPADERAAVLDVIAKARTRMPLAHLTLEFLDDHARLPDIELDGEVIAHAHFHGPPITLADRPVPEA